MLDFFELQRSRKGAALCEYATQVTHIDHRFSFKSRASYKHRCRWLPGPRCELYLDEKPSHVNAELIHVLASLVMVRLPMELLDFVLTVPAPTQIGGLDAGYLVS